MKDFHKVNQKPEEFIENQSFFFLWAKWKEHPNKISLCQILFTDYFLTKLFPKN